MSMFSQDEGCSLAFILKIKIKCERGKAEKWNFIPKIPGRTDSEVRIQCVRWVTLGQWSAN